MKASAIRKWFSLSIAFGVVEHLIMAETCFLELNLHETTNYTQADQVWEKYPLLIEDKNIQNDRDCSPSFFAFLLPRRHKTNFASFFTLLFGVAMYSSSILSIDTLHHNDVLWATFLSILCFDFTNFFFSQRRKLCFNFFYAALGSKNRFSEFLLIEYHRSHAPAVAKQNSVNLSNETLLSLDPHFLFFPNLSDKFKCYDGLSTLSHIVSCMTFRVCNWISFQFTKKNFQLNISFLCKNLRK